VPILCLLAALFAATLLNATGGTADHVAGQIDFVHSAQNFVDGRGFNFPMAVAVDPVDGEIYVADTANNRVLGWRSASEFEGNQPADLVIGQADFYSYYCNRTPGQVSPGSSPSQNTLCNPQGVAVDYSGNVYVADTGNNRVLVYANPVLQRQNSDFAADLVLGQDDTGTGFTLDACAGGQTGLCSPAAVAVGSAGALFVLDRQNNRVLEYFNPLGNPPSTGASDVVADRVFGQVDFSVNQPNQGVGNLQPTKRSTRRATEDRRVLRLTATATFT
jgi:DNA-binding beta-propeller fold protein YncE